MMNQKHLLVIADQLIQNFDTIQDYSVLGDGFDTNDCEVAISVNTDQLSRLDPYMLPDQVLDYWVVPTEHGIQYKFHVMID